MSKKLFYYGSTASFTNLYSDNLDGVNEDVLVGDNAAFSFASGGCAFGLWVKLTSTSGQLGLFSKRNGIVGQNEYYAFVFNGRVSFICEDFTTSGWIGRNTSTGLLSTGVWYYIFITYSGSAAASGIKIYVDDVQQDNANNNSGVFTTMGNTVTPFRWGSINSGLVLPGKIYHGSIWNAALTQANGVTLRALKGGDYRNVAFASNLVEPYYFPNGTTDYPTWTGYKAGINGTMINQEAADINTDIPT